MLKPLNNQPSGLKLVNPPSKHKQGFQQELHHKLEPHNQDLLNLELHNQDLHNQDPHNQDIHNKGSHKLNMGYKRRNCGTGDSSATIPTTIEAYEDFFNKATTSCASGSSSSSQSQGQRQHVELNKYLSTEHSITENDDFTTNNL
ncbi:hypothetical protein LWI29_024904 [Acer saccharum]|uniref:Uncharacterized protein n=1 Tax=Acer saccharum TaxID=4024 RepID=A0AA39VYY4_ACESA|nr:hypothetical protein LWI29_024904 [Acer saccharum]